jgi:hypothetical protein
MPFHFAPARLVGRLPAPQPLTRDEMTRIFAQELGRSALSFRV